MTALPYGGRLAIKPLDGPFVKLRGDLRTGVGVQGEDQNKNKSAVKVKSQFGSQNEP